MGGLSVLHFFDPCRYKGAVDCQKGPSSNSNGAIGPIRDTIKLTEADQK